MSEIVEHSGGCHCGAVRFTVRAEANIQAVHCNCSICSMTGFLHMFVDRDALTLTSDKSALNNYQFNTRTASHYFCNRCGVKSFYIPRSHPDGYSVNVHCLKPDTINSLEIKEFDGSNWEANVDTIR